MQDNYFGDIGDFGKYGLLRKVCSVGLSLSVNWYKVTPPKNGKHGDGKYTSYLLKPQIYREYDPCLFDVLHNIVCIQNDRRIERIEREDLFSASFFGDDIDLQNRSAWHSNALLQTAGTNTVFLDPDNGLETLNMFRTDGATEKHVKWSELQDYYDRGQNVILYQHRPQMTKKQSCIDGILFFQNNYLKADCVKLLEFPKYTNRFYFMFIHEESKESFDTICKLMVQQWGKEDFCREINVKYGD